MTYEQVNLYLDVDGVFADFERYWDKRLRELGCAGGLDTEDRDRELYKNEVADNSLFTKLLMTKNGRYLLERIKLLNRVYPELNVEMLTASGLDDSAHVMRCVKQKTEWLNANGFSDFKYNVVGRKVHKQMYVKSNRDIIIDDSAKTCKAWAGNGGSSLIYTDTFECAEFAVSFIETLILGFRAEKEFNLYV